MKLVDIIYQLNPDEFRQLLRQVQYPGPDGIGRRFTDRQIQALTELLYPLFEELRRWYLDERYNAANSEHYLEVYQSELDWFKWALGREFGLTKRDRNRLYVTTEKAVPGELVEVMYHPDHYRVVVVDRALIGHIFLAEPVETDVDEGIPVQTKSEVDPEPSKAEELLRICQELVTVLEVISRETRGRCLCDSNHYCESCFPSKYAANPLRKAKEVLGDGKK